MYHLLLRTSLSDITFHPSAFFIAAILTAAQAFLVSAVSRVSAVLRTTVLRTTRELTCPCLILGLPQPATPRSAFPPLLAPHRSHVKRYRKTSSSHDIDWLRIAAYTRGMVPYRTWQYTRVQAGAALFGHRTYHSKQQLAQADLAPQQQLILPLSMRLCHKQQATAMLMPALVVVILASIRPKAIARPEPKLFRKINPFWAEDHQIRLVSPRFQPHLSTFQCLLILSIIFSSVLS